MPGNEATITFEGQREFRRALRNLGDDLEDLKAIHGHAAAIVEERAVDIVPIVTGTLRSTIRSSGTKTKGVLRAGYGRVPYAGPIHFGWPSRNIRPQPFLYDALDERREQVLDLFDSRVQALARSRGLDVRTG